MENQSHVFTKEEEREQIIQNNMGLVFQVARRFEGRGVEWDDLIQIGSIGLVKAVDHFDKEKGFQLSTYAVPYIMGELKRYFRDSQAIHFSRHLRELSVLVYKTKEEMFQKTGREPTIEDLEREMKIPREDLIASLDASRQVKSLEENLITTEDGQTTLLHTLADTRQLEEEIITKMTLKNAMKGLSKKEQSVICLRFFCGKNQSEIARMISLSQAQVSRIEKGALQTLYGRLQDTFQ